MSGNHKKKDRRANWQNRLESGTGTTSKLSRKSNRRVLLWKQCWQVRLCWWRRSELTDEQLWNDHSPDNDDCSTARMPLHQSFFVDNKMWGWLRGNKEEQHARGVTGEESRQGKQIFGSQIRRVQISTLKWSFENQRKCLWYASPAWPSLYQLSYNCQKGTRSFSKHAYAGTRWLAKQNLILEMLFSWSEYIDFDTYGVVLKSFTLWIWFTGHSHIQEQIEIHLRSMDMCQTGSSTCFEHDW